MGDYHFIDAYQEDETGYIYELGTSDGTVTHLAAWLPIDGNDGTTRIVNYPSNIPSDMAIRIEGESPTGTLIPTPAYNGGNISLTLSTKPIIVSLDGSCPPVGTPCSDGDPNTLNDAHDGNCNCIGTCPAPGMSCDDGNPDTFDDTYNDDCFCLGRPVGDGCEFIVNGTFDG